MCMTVNHATYNNVCACDYVYHNIHISHCKRHATGWRWNHDNWTSEPPFNRALVQCLSRTHAPCTKTCCGWDISDTYMWEVQKVRLPCIEKRLLLKRSMSNWRLLLHTNHRIWCRLPHTATKRHLHGHYEIKRGTESQNLPFNGSSCTQNQVSYWRPEQARERTVWHLGSILYSLSSYRMHTVDNTKAQSASVNMGIRDTDVFQYQQYKCNT